MERPSGAIDTKSEPSLHALEAKVEAKVEAKLEAKLWTFWDVTLPRNPDELTELVI